MADLDATLEFLAKKAVKELGGRARLPKNAKEVLFYCLQSAARIGANHEEARIANRLGELLREPTDG